MATTVERTHLTPPEVAKRLGISAEKVVGFLLAGELIGVNLASQGSTRPRYRISEHHLAEFLERRAASVKPAVSVVRRRRKATPGMREYF